MTKTILVVFGTRPEAIKMCPLIKAINRNTSLHPIVCVTGQHREMLDQVLDIFNIKPDFDLDIMKDGQDLYDITSRVLLGLRDILINTKPNLVLVHGDTSTAFAASLAAFYQHIPVAHIEAGLRTYNLEKPFPEEANRQLISRISKYNFAPTSSNKKNLVNEGIDPDSIFEVGNTVIDALHYVNNKIHSDDFFRKSIIDNIKKYGYDVSRLSEGKKLILITGHRRENIGDGLYNICKAIAILSEEHPDIDFVYPMHLNPSIRSTIRDVLGMYANDSAHTTNNIFLIEPLNYVDFVYMMANSFCVLTDSGGIQEEAPGLGKPVIVMRETTEREEAVSAGTVSLVGTNTNAIVSEINKLIHCPQYYNGMANSINPYGDGKTCDKIVKILSSL